MLGSQRPAEYSTPIKGNNDLRSFARANWTRTSQGGWGVGRYLTEIETMPTDEAAKLIRERQEAEKQQSTLGSSGKNNSVRPTTARHTTLDPTAETASSGRHDQPLLRLTVACVHSGVKYSGHSG